MRYSMPLLLLAVFPAPLAAQHPRDDAKGVYRFGYEYSPWQVTPWSVLEYRTKCEGEPVRGMEAGPIRWVVEVRNRSTDLINFSYVIQPPGEKKRPSAKGRARTKPGDTFVKLTSLPTSRCDDGVTIRLDSVRAGPDVNNAEYLKPDRGP